GETRTIENHVLVVTERQVEVQRGARVQIVVPPDGLAAGTSGQLGVAEGDIVVAYGQNSLAGAVRVHIIVFELNGDLALGGDRAKRRIEGEGAEEQVRARC